MRFVLAAVLAFAVSADESCDQSESVSMLQTKDRLAAKDGSLLQNVNLASQDFDRADDRVQDFINKVKDAAKSMHEPQGKEALLQRASQGEKMQALIGDFAALPLAQQQKLEVVGADIFEKMPGAHKTALVQQVSHALDSSVSSKPETKTEQTAKGKKTTTYDKATGYYHSHEHGKHGTESVSKAKHGGHEHRHTYSHDGKGGNARTSSHSKGGGHEHSHSTSHSLNNGVTRTGTSSASNGGGHVHTHGHTHTHAQDRFSSTGTSSFSKDKSGTSHGHSHSTVHNEVTGDSHTHSRATENGRTSWDHDHHSDGSSGHRGGHDHHDHDDRDDHDNHDHHHR